MSDNFLKLVKQNEKKARLKGLKLVDPYFATTRLIQSDYVLRRHFKKLINKSLLIYKNHIDDGKSTKI